MEPDAGVILPASGEQHVEWAEVAQAREPASGEHVYTVAAQTDTAGLVYLTVDVARSAGGTLELDGYPAFVGPPAAGPAQSAPPIARSLRTGARGGRHARPAQLPRGRVGRARSRPQPGRARLASGAFPDAANRCSASNGQDGGARCSQSRSRTTRGGQYKLAYELDVVRQQGRWEVSAVQTDPDS